MLQKQPKANGEGALLEEQLTEKGADIKEVEKKYRQNKKSKGRKEE